MIKSNTSRKPSPLTSTIKLFLISVSFSLLAWQCISPPDFVGGDLIPQNDIFRVKTDTSFRLSAFTMPFDTVITMGFEEAMIGETFDGVFGRTKASFVTQIRLSVPGYDFGINPQIDSAILYLKVKERFGNEPLNIKVYQIGDSLQLDSIYNSLAPAESWFTHTEIGSNLLNPYNGKDTYIKIPIYNNWAQSMLINGDSASMADNKNFTKYIYGIYVTTQGNFPNHAKGMYNIDYLSTETRLAVYYKNDELEGDNPLVFACVLDANCRRFNHFIHDKSVANSQITMTYNDTVSTQDSVFYIQGIGGARGVIRLDDLFAWIDSLPIAINRAELRIEIEEHDNLPVDSVITNLLLYKKVGNTYQNIVDYNLSPEFFGGRYSRNKKYYSFNITNHVQQQIKSSNPNNILYIEQRLTNRRANGAVLRSGSHSSRMKLILTYTKY
jgi:hypothetical protein